MKGSKLLDEPRSPERTSRHARRALWVSVAIESCLIAWMSRHGAFLRAGEAWRFTLLGMFSGLAYWLAVCSFTRANLTHRESARWLWAAAILLRLAVLPVLVGDDIWRYRWEGYIQLHGFNPYQLAPDSPALTALRNADWDQINHRNFPAIYPPLTELIFAALAAIGTPPVGYKLLFLLADLGVVGVLRRLLARGGAPPQEAAWYAWNPLAVYVSAGAAHFDALMVLALLGAIWALDKFSTQLRPEDADSWRAPPLMWGSVLLLGMAIALKAVPLALLPVWVFALGWRRSILALPLAAAVPLALALVYGFPQTPVFVGLRTFANDFRVNEPIWWLVDWLVQAKSDTQYNRLYQGIAALVCGALAVWFRRDWQRGMLWVLGTALILSPVLHAWYVLWLLPLAAWRGPGARPWFVFSISAFGYFLMWEVNHDSGKPWVEPVWLRLLIYLPPLISLGCMAVFSSAASRRKTC